MIRKLQPTHYHTGGYIPIRNDATILSIAERNFITSSSSTSTTTNATPRSIDHENLYIRVDGRKRTEPRPISIQLLRHHRDDRPTDPSSRSSNGGNGCGSHSSTTTTTATVTYGSGTRVSCTVTSELVAPNMDRPNDGMLAFTIDLSPSASTSYRYATPASTYHLGASSTTTTTTTSSNLPNADRHQKITSNHILRTLERCFVQPGGAIDTEALCVVPGAYVWKIHCACTILDDAGNIMDASVLACIAAIRHYRQPVMELVSSSPSSSSSHSPTAETTATNTVATPIIIPSHIKEPTPLPLLHTPIAITFLLIANNNSTTSSSSSSSSSTSMSIPHLGILMDPTYREELCSHGRITLGMNVYQEICFVDVTTGYQCEVQWSDLQYCHAVAISHVTTICHTLESALSEADELDRNQRLLQLQQQQQTQLPLPPPMGKIVPPGFDHDDDDDDDNNEEDQVVESSIKNYDDEEDEDMAYRRRALDFTIGHVASKVRENNYVERTNHTTPPPHGISTTTLKQNSSSKPTNTLLNSMLRSLGGQQQQQQQEDTTTKSAVVALPLPTDHGTKQNDFDDEEEDVVIELKSEFVMNDSNATRTTSSKTNKRKR